MAFREMIVRNILFYAGIIPATLLFTLLGLLSFSLPFRFRYWIITRWSHFFIFWAKLTCGLKYKVIGLENLPKQTANANENKNVNVNAIVMSNHQSVWETIFMQVLLPPQTWVLKKELLKIPVFGWGLALLDPIAINRKHFSSIKELIRQGKQKLNAGRWVVLFPEGTRVKPGEQKRFTRSGFALAEATGYPILPMAHNAGLFWPKGFFIKKSGEITIMMGELVDTKSASIEEISKSVEKWVREKTQSLIQPTPNAKEISREDL